MPETLDPKTKLALTLHLYSTFGEDIPQAELQKRLIALSQKPIDIKNSEIKIWLSEKDYFVLDQNGEIIEGIYYE